MLISALMDLCGMNTRNSEEEDDEGEVIIQLMCFEILLILFHYLPMIQSCSLEYEYKMKLPSYEECMMAEPCKVKLDVEIHKAAAEKNMISM